MLIFDQTLLLKIFTSYLRILDFSYFFFLGIVVRFGFVTIEAPFDTDLNNPDSLIYQQMSANIKTALTELFCIQRFSICAVQITGFRSGSIVANFFVTLSGETSDVIQFLDMQFKTLPSSIDFLQNIDHHFSNKNNHGETA